MDEPVPEFATVEAECAFWKSKARELKTELDEFTEDSHQLEKELEITIKLKDDQLTDLRHKYNRQQHENDSLVGKLRQCENELLQWEQRHKKEKADAETLRKHTRELEQKNDDLERAHRIVSESVTEFERMLNREYEKNVMLEVEYEMEKENAQIQLQRLMDEARDLKQELKIQQKQPGSQRINGTTEGDNEKHDKDMDTEEGEQKANELAGEKADAKKMETDDSPQSNGVVNVNGVLNCRQHKLNGHAESGSVAPAPPPSSTANLQRESSLKQMDRLKNNSMTASSRSTALAIVADLLRRVNECLQLDNKLACIQCKALHCECPDRRSSSRQLLPDSESDASLTPGQQTRNSDSNRTAAGNTNSSCSSNRLSWTALPTDTERMTSRNGDSIKEDRPAAIRLASILGLKNLDSVNGGHPTTPTTAKTVRPSSSASASGKQEVVQSSPAATWLKDKYQMATNKFMSKNIDATLKELKRPKSIDDDLCETNDPRDDGGGTMHGQREKEAKSPSMIC